jgi:cytochrome c-type biogenesis protein CcmH/NrfG
MPILERAVQENPANAQAWAALGATQLLVRRVEEGVESLRRGMRISPTDYRRSVWQTALAGGLVRLKQYEEAVEIAHAACRSDVNFAPARIVLAGALMKLGREAEAGKALAEARRLRPQLTVPEVRLWVGNRSLDKFDAGLTLPRTPA